MSEPVKLVVLLWGEPSTRADRRARVIDRLAPDLLALKPARLVAYVEDPDSDLPSPNPFRGPDPLPFAALDLWVAELADRAPFEAVLEAHGLSFHAWRVEESVYTDYGGNRHAAPRDWPDGQRSPGVVALTLLERPPRLDRAAWIARWHGQMSPISEAIQPRTRYVRNLVVEALTDGAPPWEGIVAECWPSARHVTNPFLFYGAGRNPLKLVVNLLRILRAVTGFTRLTRVRTLMMGEYFLATR